MVGKGWVGWVDGRGFHTTDKCSIDSAAHTRTDLDVVVAQQGLHAPDPEGLAAALRGRPRARVAAAAPRGRHRGRLLATAPLAAAAAALDAAHFAVLGLDGAHDDRGLIR